MFFTLKKPTLTVPAEIDGVTVRASGRARRLSLRADPRTGDVVLVWPRRASEKSARRFIAEQRAWIEMQRAKIKPARDFAAGVTLSVRGAPLLIVPVSGRGLTRVEGDRLLVHGGPEHLARRVRDFLKKEAADLFQQLCDEKSAALGLPPAPIRILDPRTRWGSCGPDGRMMFSWRLVLAPPEVADYLAAHEVAHRIHMNHGRKFWTLCQELSPHSVKSKAWLRRHGDSLMGWR